MPGPNDPPIATFPVPPPLFNFPWTQPLNGQQILTPQAISFLQLLWASIQGQGGIIDLSLIGIPQPGTALALAEGAVAADYRAIAELGAAKAEIAALRQEIVDLAQAVLQRSIWGAGGGGGTPGGTTGQIQYNNAGVFGGFDMSGDATTNTTTGVLTLATVATAGTYGDSLNIPVLTLDVKGRTLTVTPTAIPLFTSTVKGLAPLSGGGTTNYLRADGTWSAPPGGGGTPGGLVGQIQFNNSGAFGGFDANGDATINVLTGAVLIQSNAVTTGKINNAAVTYAKIQNVSANSVLLGSSATGSGAAPSEIILGSNLSMSGSTLNASGSSGTVTSVAMTVPTSVLSVSGSPITTSGTLAITLATQTANTIFAGPTTGAAAAPTFRAMVTADIPNSIVTEAKLLLANNTTANVSITAHGFTPILPNDATKFLDGTGAYSVPTGSGGTPANPTATAGPAAVNGSASTYMRSDAAPAVRLGTNSQTGLLQGDGSTTNVSAGVISVIGVPPSANYAVPNIGTFSWVNQSTSTATQTVSGGSVLMTNAPNASLNWRGLFIAQPSTPYKVIAQLKFGSAITNSQTAGIYFYDGTKWMGIENLTQGGVVTSVRVEKLANSTTDSATSATLANSASPFWGGNWMQLRNSGTTLFFDVSLDGVNFINVYSEAVGTFITPTQIGYGGVNVTSAATWFLNVLNWRTVANANLN